MSYALISYIIDLTLGLTKFSWQLAIQMQGLSVCSAIIDGEKHLVAFGGYNGKYSNEVYCLTTFYSKSRFLNC